MITKFKLFENRIEILDEDRATANAWLITNNIAITAYHCVAQAYNDKGELDARLNFVQHSKIAKQVRIKEILAFDMSSDLCLIKLEEKQDLAIPYGIADPTEIKVGMPVWTVGHVLWGQLDNEPAAICGHIISIDKDGYITTDINGFAGCSGMILLNEISQIVGCITGGHVSNLYSLAVPLGAIIFLLERENIKYCDMVEPIYIIDNIDNIKQNVALLDVPHPSENPTDFMKNIVSLMKDLEDK